MKMGAGGDALGGTFAPVNGRVQTVDVDELTLDCPKFGCDLGQCGADLVIVKGQAIRNLTKELI